MLEWIATLSPTAIIGIVFYFVIGGMRTRIKSLEDEKVNKEVCNIVQEELKKSIDEVKKSNGKIVDKLEEQHVAAAEMKADLKYIVREIKKNNH